MEEEEGDKGGAGAPWSSHDEEEGESRGFWVALEVGNRINCLLRFYSSIF